MVPSSYVNAKNYDKGPFGLYLALTLSGQGAPFKNPVKNIPAAQRWLREFWLKRLDQELQLQRANDWDPYGYADAR